MREKLTASYVFDQMVPKILSEQPDIAQKVRAVLGIEILGESGGYWTIDLTDEPRIERGRTKEPKCMLSAHVDDFEELLSNGSIRAALEAFKKKRIQAKGHLPTILKLERLLMAMVSNQ